MQRPAEWPQGQDHSKSVCRACSGDKACSKGMERSWRGGGVEEPRGFWTLKGCFSLCTRVHTCALMLCAQAGTLGRVHSQGPVQACTHARAMHFPGASREPGRHRSTRSKVEVGQGMLCCLIA